MAGAMPFCGKRVLSILAIAGLPAAPMALAQSCGTDLTGSHTLESAHYTVAYRTKPEKIAVGSHFVVEFAVCPKGGAPAPESVQVDAYMPDHRHGMNYQAVVKPAGNGRYQAGGMMFHMPGKWDFIFEVRGSANSERLSRSLTLE